METILVVFTKKKLESAAEINRLKKYAYNTKSYLKEGDMTPSRNYDSLLQVVNVMSEAYNYYDASTGNMSIEPTSSNSWRIKELVLNQVNDDNIVYGRLL
jgi:hypothetical protein